MQNVLDDFFESKLFNDDLNRLETARKCRATKCIQDDTKQVRAIVGDVLQKLKNNPKMLKLIMYNGLGDLLKSLTAIINDASIKDMLLNAFARYNALSKTMFTDEKLAKMIECVSTMCTTVTKDEFLAMNVLFVSFVNLWTDPEIKAAMELVSSNEKKKCEQLITMMTTCGPVKDVNASKAAIAKAEKAAATPAKATKATKAAVAKAEKTAANAASKAISKKSKAAL